MEIVKELIGRIEKLSAEVSGLRARLSTYQEYVFAEQAKAQPKRRRSSKRSPA
jgi:hypothetical protein